MDHLPYKVWQSEIFDSGESIGLQRKEPYVAVVFHSKFYKDKKPVARLEKIARKKRLKKNSFVSAQSLLNEDWNSSIKISAMAW